MALMARGKAPLEDVEKAIADAGGRALPVIADASEPGSVSAAFAEVRATLGDPDVLVYNAGVFKMGEVTTLAPEHFEACWKANCFGAFLAAREVVPAMVRRGRGTLLFTGATASLRGSASFSCLAVGKFGLRALAQSLARELGSKGVHVAHIIIDGQIDTPRVRTMFPGRAAGTLLDPEAIARTYWNIHTQDATAWTLEIDLRPATERF